ncbi:MAG: hypothetical protein HYZ53_01405 [Planctomycetes bacterium]|nr:hypothetical protein [Planctomycetota bacterium]
MIRLLELFRCLVALLLALVVASPILVLLPEMDLGRRDATYGEGTAAGAAPAVAAALSPAPLAPWFRTLGLAALAAGLALFLGLPGARALAGAGPAAARRLVPLTLLPLLVPLPLHAIAWIGLAGRQGALNRAARAALRLAEAPLNVYSLPAAAFVLALALWPCVALAGAIGYRAVGRSGLEAARFSGGPLAVAWRIVRPALSPYLGWSVVAVALLAAAEPSVPSILQVEVGAMQVFTRFERDWNVGAAVGRSLPLVLFGGCAAAALAAFGCGLPGRRPVDARADEGGVGPGPAGRGVRAAFVVVLLLSVGLPIGGMLVDSRSPSMVLETLRVSAGQVRNTFFLSAASAGLAAAFALAIVLLLPRRGRVGLSLAVLGVAALPFLLPGAFAGIGLLRLSTLPLLADVLEGSPLRVVLAGLHRYGALALGLALVARADATESALEAARLAGAGRLAIFRWVTLPPLLPALAAGGYVVYALSAGELSSVQLVAPAGSDTLAMRLFALIHYQYEAKVAALALVQLALVFVPGLVAARWLAWRRPA